MLQPAILLLVAVVTFSSALQIPFQRPQPLTTLSSTSPNDDAPPPSQPPAMKLTLRHGVHVTTRNRHIPALHKRFDAADLVEITSETGFDSSQLTLRQIPTTAWKPSSRLAFQAARRAAYQRAKALRTGVMPTWDDLADEALAATLEWHEHDIYMPNISDVTTISSLAKMANNAYSKKDGGGWIDPGGHWNVSDSFGWQEDGIRGHVFADETNSTIVVAIKGTSAGFVGGGGSTGHNDKVNDNLLFSCCCARVDWTWTPVCDCYDGSYKCKQDCLEEAVMEKSAYYPAATDLYNNISALYPHSQIWLTGHSLGGSLAGLLSRTYGVPSVSYESPGDLLPAKRLHLPMPPPSTKFKRGKSRCHQGQKIVYDTVGRLGWNVDIRTHSIKPVIERVLIEDWGVDEDERNQVAPMRKRSLFGWWPLPGGGKHKDDDNKGDDDKPDKEVPDEDDGQHGGRGVPSPKLEDADCWEQECFRWTYE
ncbi:putative lipase atg15 [Microbotryomycetes sp. JL201]|nr:putative lipase atg15 [Microbotryomycetes sp. JL201]